MAKNESNSTMGSDERFLGVFNYRETKNIANTLESSTTSVKNDGIQRKKYGKFLKPSDTPQKEDEISTESSSRLNNTDYVTYQKPKPINISDLITDKTINLESSTAKHFSNTNKISFEPGEITARSTHHKNELLNKADIQSKSARLSVSEILATSFAPRARNLRNSLQSLTHCAIPAIRSSDASSVNSDDSRSLPRTADMSLTKNATNSSFGVALNESDFPALDHTEYNSEEFMPAELMQSKLISDEISWAQKYAAIPAAALSEEAKLKAKRSSLMEQKSIDLSAISNSKIGADPDFSLGSFFNMRSENIWNIIPCKSPDKCRSPIPLVDEAVDNTKLGSLLSSDMSKTGNNSFCLKSDIGKHTLECKSGESHESKDSGNASDSSYLLSVSAIDRALCNLDIHTDDSEISVIEKFMDQAKMKCNRNVKSNEIDIKAHPELHPELAITNDLRENKENVDPKLPSGYNLSDTLSFTESLLNFSELKRFESTQSIDKVRSPLSPLENDISKIAPLTENENLDADIDEWPSTPVVTANRSRRLKTHKNQLKKFSLPFETLNMKSSENKTMRSCNGITVSKESRTKISMKKSLCSTLLDGDKCQINDGDTMPAHEFSSSINSSHTHPTSEQIIPENHSPVSPCHQKIPKDNHKMSPLASPPNSDNGSNLCSPISSASYRSTSPPHTNSSDSSYRRSLNERSAVCKINSSPIFREVFNIEGAPLRTSKSSTTTVSRCTSSCSNSSEFSHRDGKSIPMKVSALSISWGSTKLRTVARKSMRVKSTSTKRLVMRVEVDGPGFQMVDTQGNIFILQSQECRSIIIEFCPTVLGTAIGTLSFYSPKCTTTRSGLILEIPLYGYGGQAKVVAHPFLRGPVGAAFLPMAELRELARPVEKRFKVYNNGPLLGFAFISIDPISSKHPCLVDSFDISPKRMLIAPGNTVTVRILFRPKREDVKNIAKSISSVLTLANMRIISGDEGNRQRIRRIIARMPLNQRSKIASAYIEMICGEFPHEIDMNELDAFHEKPDIMLDLFSTFCVQEVALTLNKNLLNETVDLSAMSFSDADETILFRTVCSKSPSPKKQLLEAVEEQLENTIVPSNYNDEGVVSSPHDGKRIVEASNSDGHVRSSTNGDNVVRFSHGDQWAVYPDIIEFDFNRKGRDEFTMLSITSTHKERRYFNIKSNHKDLFHFEPKSGYLGPGGGEAIIFITCDYEWPPSDLRNSALSITVFMENEHKTLPVKIPEDNFF